MASASHTDESPDLLLSLVPLGALARQTFRHPINQTHYRAGPKLVDLSKNPPPIDSRESTPEAALGEAVTDPKLVLNTVKNRDEPAIQLTLEKPPRCPSTGFAFGSDPNRCDVWVGYRRDRISPIAFTINLTKARRFLASYDEQSILTDINEQEGLLVISTARDSNPLVVSYGKGEDPIVQSRYNFVLFSEKEVITVTLANSLHFEIMFPSDGNLARAKTKLIEELKDSCLSINELQQKICPPVKNTTGPPAFPFKYEAKYTKFSDLGEGRFGTVHEVREVSTAARFAMKMVVPGNERSGEYRSAWQMLSHEFKALSRLDHKRIVTSHELIRAFGSLCLIMEMIPLGDLGKLTKQRELTMEEAAIVLWQSLDALNYMHAQDITHRDLKTSNMLVAQINPSIKIKLVDFGLAKVPRNSADYLKTFCGTAGFMAPEMFTGNRAELFYTSAVDVWALGVVMLECLNIRPATEYLNRTRSEWCNVLVFTFQAAWNDPKGPIRAYLTNVTGRALLRLKAVARLSAGETLTYFAGFFKEIQSMDDAADRELKRNSESSGMPPGWSDSLTSYCAQEMRTKNFFPNLLPTDKKEDPERPQEVAGSNDATSQKKTKPNGSKSQKQAESDGARSQKKVAHKPAAEQPRDISVDKDGQTIVKPKTTPKAGTAPKAPAAAQASVKASSDSNTSPAGQPKKKGTSVTAGRKHGHGRDEAEEAVGGSTSQKRKCG